MNQEIISSTQQMTGAAATIFITISGYLLYYFISSEKAIRNRFFTGNNESASWIRWVFFQKLTGVLFLGVLPGYACLILFKDVIGMTGITFIKITDHLAWFAVTPFIMVIMGFLGARQPDTRGRYPEMRIPEWTRSRYMVSSLGWIAYLFSYEFLFRGILLFGCYAAFGKWPAIAVNIAIYAAVHMVKGWRETLGSVVFGIAACLVALYTGTMLLPFFAHAVMAVSTEYFSIRFNPQMKFVKRAGQQ